MLDQLRSHPMLPSRLRELRGDTPLATLSLELGKDASSISRYETGATIPPDDFLLRFCSHFKVTIQELIPPLKVGTAPYSDYCFFALICRTSIDQQADRHSTSPLAIETIALDYPEILSALQSRKVDVCIYPHDLAMRAAYSGQLNNISILPVIYSIKINPLLATRHGDLLTFGQHYLHTPGEDRQRRYQLALAKTLGQLANPEVELCLAPTSSRVFLLQELARYASAGLTHSDSKLKDQVVALVKRVTDIQASDPDVSKGYRSLELDAYQYFVRCASKDNPKNGKPAVFIGGLAHRIMAEEFADAGILLGESSLLNIASFAKGLSSHISPRFSVLVNQEAARWYAQEIEQIAQRWNAAVDSIAQERANMFMINSLIDADMARAHGNDQGGWRGGIGLFETFLVHHLIDLKRWPPNPVSPAKQ